MSFVFGLVGVTGHAESARLRVAGSCIGQGSTGAQVRWTDRLDLPHVVVVHVKCVYRQALVSYEWSKRRSEQLSKLKVIG